MDKSIEEILRTNNLIDFKQTHEFIKSYYVGLEQEIERLKYCTLCDTGPRPETVEELKKEGWSYWTTQPTTDFSLRNHEKVRITISQVVGWFCPNCTREKNNV